MLRWLHVWLTCTMLKPITQIRDSIFIKKPVNADIVVSLIMTNLLPYRQKIEPLGNMLKQLQILLKK
ncbi:hypothetical protein Goari_001186 [Gossypium aridum]|uniref:Uncharacterized protein n=1 Tax=Gossypium aridum TaxID=34290 RepID=A0A7J8YKL6_GOSAI|nr:hypothetical protein [Gossypium aridum]